MKHKVEIASLVTKLKLTKAPDEEVCENIVCQSGNRVQKKENFIKPNGISTNCIKCREYERTKKRDPNKRKIANQNYNSSIKGIIAIHNGQERNKEKHKVQSLESYHKNAEKINAEKRERTRMMNS